MTYQKSQVVQSNNYYAFGGSTQDSWTRVDTKPNQYLYNAGSELNSQTKNYEMFFRDYDPWTGRMSGVDPMADKYSSLTPYNYAFNDPVTFNDPSGADPYNDPNFYHGSVPRGAYFYTDMVYADGGVPYRDRGEFYSGDSTSALRFHMGGRDGSLTNVISGYAPDFGGPVLVQMKDGTYTYMLPSRIESERRRARHTYTIELDWEVFEDDAQSEISFSNGMPVAMHVTYLKRSSDFAGTNACLNCDWFAQKGAHLSTERFTPISNNGEPHVQGIYILLKYSPAEGHAYVKYNWMWRTKLNEQRTVFKVNINDFTNSGPFFYGEGDDGDRSKFGGSHVYSSARFPMMSVDGEMTLFGQKENSEEWTRLATVTYSFAYYEGQLTTNYPVIQYYGAE